MNEQMGITENSVSGTNRRLINVSCYTTAHWRLGWVTHERPFDLEQALPHLHSVPSSAPDFGNMAGGWEEQWGVEARTQTFALRLPV